MSTRDLGGGAERVALNLHHAYQALGHQAFLAVGQKKSAHPNIAEIPHAKYRHFAYQYGDQLRHLRGLWRLSRPLTQLAEPRRTLARRAGYEDFEFPATRHLLDLPPFPPQLVHGHNLHGGYFDLRELAVLSHKIPVFLTLHDEWLFTGHCAYSIDCRRWETGCGNCPDLSLYPALPQDKTAENWQRKQAIYAQARLYIITPSRWLMAEAERSNLAAGMAGQKVIPNGIDLEVFQPSDRAKIRAELGLPQQAFIVLYSWAGTGTNPYKDYDTLQHVFEELKQHTQPILGLRLGHTAPPEKLSETLEIRSIPFVSEPAQLAKIYQAADVYCHAAKAENLPNAISEAMACGIPVIATKVGGIPEQVQVENLVPKGDFAAMARKILNLYHDPAKRQKMGADAANIARQNYDLKQQVQIQLAWYTEVLDENH